jgi:hypothetical protein
MPASANAIPTARDLEITAAFEALLPELKRLFKAFLFKCRDRQEAMQEMIAFSWWNYSQAARRNVILTPVQLAFVARRRVRSGRTLGTSMSSVDVHSRLTQLKRRANLISLSALSDDPDRILPKSGIGRRFVEAITYDQENPAEEARIKVDWSDLRETLNNRQQNVLDGLAEGRLNSETADKLKVSRGRITQIVGEVAGKVVERFGYGVAPAGWGGE